MFRRLFIFILCLAALSGAGRVLALSPRVEADGGDLLINNILVCRFRVPEGGVAPAMRARMAAMRIMELSGPELTPDSVSCVRLSDDLWRITVRGSAVISAQTEDALQLSSTAEGLAGVWVNNIRAALQAVPIYLDASSFTLPLGEQRSWLLHGSYTMEPSLAMDDPEVASVRYDPVTRSIAAYGKSLGVTRVTITAGDFTFEFVIRVKKPAAVIPDSCTFSVTGNPCPASVIRAGLRGAVCGNIKAEPGASTVVEGIDWTDVSLASGAGSTASVRVSCKGNDYLTVSKVVCVRIQNCSEKREKPARIFYSNHPETMKSFQDLFTGTLEQGVCTRLLYHHLNATGRNANLRIELINAGDEPAVVRSTRTAIKPMVDTISVGLQAAKGFMGAEEKNISTYDVIPPRSVRYYLSDVMRPNDTSSGVMEFTQKDGAAGCVVRVSLVRSGSADPAVYSCARYSGTGSFDEDDYIFDEPVKEYNETYEVGKSWVFISVGKEHLTTEKGTKLYGNYGVTYRMNFTITNPTQDERKVRVGFDPSAGAAAAYFTVNGEGVTIHHIKPPAEFNIYTATLKPGETRRLTVETMPVSGSNYPAKVIVGPVSQ
ncbi:MAG: hypothetical protein J5758_02685 [Abditibacteriota bacterium]|nr:hypothetical protein [Abditibacteriota bacterium]